MANWDALAAKYSGKYDNWRLPSRYAVDHMRYKGLEKIFKQEVLDSFELDLHHPATLRL